MNGNIQRKDFSTFSIQSFTHIVLLCGHAVFSPPVSHRICLEILSEQLSFCYHYTTEHLTVARSDTPVVPPKQASTSSSIKPSSISPKVMPAALSMSPPKTAVTTLKEYCEKNGLPQPQYSEIPLHKEQQFQFQVSLRSVEVTGKVCSSKQQAKQSAAQLANQNLGL